MERIININFQGRVIPIEETAYNNLKQYIESLRTHFANEESHEEIINDIENRIAELLSERLKQGALCINMMHLNAVIDSIGRLEDIEAAEGEEVRASQSSSDRQSENEPVLKGRLFRNADDKVIAGVCSGIAIRTGIDPIIVRIAFVLLVGALLPIYILLWIIVPSQSIRSNITRRLYRNPDDNVIAGVCGGLAVYFRIDTWIPRVIFSLPFIIGILSGGAHAFFWHSYWGMGPRVFTGSFGSTLFLLYVILWIALPYASTATDKLEMRGEKIDLNSIKAATQANAGSIHPQHREGSGFGRIIGILFKAFFLFIAGVAALGLFGALIGIVFAGTVAVPFTDFLLEGWGQYTVAWAGVILFLGIPLLAFITWIVRRLMGVRSHRHYLGYVFVGLWFLSFISVVTLAAILIRNFSSRAMDEKEFALKQPSINKLYVNVSKDMGTWGGTHHGRWFGDWDDDDDTPFRIVNNDSLWLNTVKVNVTQSADSLFHVYETRISRANTITEAKVLASHIPFSMVQRDSIIILPAGFCIGVKDKFRNQQMLVRVEVPLGKAIQFNKEINNYHWFTVNTSGHNLSYEGHWDDDYDYTDRSEYIMTATGLKNPKDSTSAKTSIAEN